MKRFFLLRHSFAEYFADSDRARELTPEGTAAARECGAMLKRLGFRPDLVIFSPARRARQTAERIAAALSVPQEKQIAEERLYDCSGEEIPAILEPYFAQGETLLAVGHNPAVSEWVSSCGDPVNLRPCEGRFFQCEETAWSESAPAKNKTMKTRLPKVPPINFCPDRKKDRTGSLRRLPGAVTAENAPVRDFRETKKGAAGILAVASMKESES